MTRTSSGVSGVKERPNERSAKNYLIGTGLMGVTMSRNLLAAGHDLTVWNRSPYRAARVVDEGAKTAATAAEAQLADTEFQAALTPGAIWIDMSSAKPEHARAQSAQLAKLGVAHLDAPVSGGTKGAQAATLAIMAGGKADVFESMRRVFEALGRAVHVGPSGAGQLSKLANQTIVAVAIAAVAEATLLAEKGGADPAALRAALRGGWRNRGSFGTLSGTQETE